MSKQAGQKKGSGKSFVMLEKYLLESPAWRSLNATTRQAYVEFKRRFNGSNNGSLSMSARDLAGDLHIGKSTANRCIQTLCERGFIEVTRESSFNVKFKAAAEYRLTENFCNRTNRQASKAFMKWTEEKNTVPSQATTVPSQVQTKVKQSEITVHSPISGTERRRLA